MVEISIPDDELAAFDPFRPVIALMNYRVALLEILLRQLADALSLLKSLLPEPYFPYIDNEGKDGFRNQVIPPLFEITPFFSRIS